MDKQSDGFQILPETKIGALLERFPQLEKVLLEMAPQFKQLHSPILRRTVGKVASLSQAAAIGKVPLTDMINTLRREAGFQEVFSTALEEDVTSEEAPGWFNESQIVKTLDARPLLAAGEQPIQRVLQEVKMLSEGEIYALITPFIPAPLIEAAQNQGYQVWENEAEPGVYKTFFRGTDQDKSR